MMETKTQQIARYINDLQPTIQD